MHGLYLHGCRNFTWSIKYVNMMLGVIVLLRLDCD